MGASASPVPPRLPQSLNLETRPGPSRRALQAVRMQDMRRLDDRLEPWLDDGNIILAVEGKFFRVHRSILRSYSEVFRDMFAIPHSDDIEKEIFDGCPVIQLQDAVADVQIMLRAFYDRSYVFFHNTPMPLTVLAAFLRLGKKYGIRQLFEEAKRRLSFDISPLVLASTMFSAGNATLFPRISGNDPFNFRVMNIAAEVGLLSQVIVATFYCCIACPALSIADGYDYDGVRCTLSPSNQRFCLLGQRYLAEVEKQLFTSLAYPAPACQYRFSSQNPCNSGILSILRAIQDLQCPLGSWVNSWDNGLCLTCRSELRRRHEDTATRLWKNLPINLGLDNWEDLDKDAEVS